MARHLDLAVTPWGILHSGVLTGKYSRQKPDESTRLGERQLSEHENHVTDTVIEVAHELECTPAQVATNWVRQQPGIMLPIIGAKSMPQLEDNLKALDFPLSDEQMQRLNEVSAIELGFPSDFLHSNDVRNLVFSGTFNQVDNHHLK